MASACNSKNRKGFTLVEMLTVLSLIAVSYALVAPHVGNSVENGKAVFQKHSDSMMREMRSQDPAPAAPNFGTPAPALAMTYRQMPQPAIPAVPQREEYAQTVQRYYYMPRVDRAAQNMTYT